MQLVVGEPDVPRAVPPHGHAVQEAAEDQGGGATEAAGAVHADPREPRHHLHRRQSLLTHVDQLQGDQLNMTL